jgi:Rps23 Pro-64 3,4-dihydroxylase Tpa1-like proline 4-hydroxylase
MDDIAQKIVDAGDDGLWSEIERNLLSLVEQDPTDTSILHRLGLVYRQSGQLTKAAEIYARLMAMDDEDGFAKILWQICSGNLEKNTYESGPVEPARFVLRRNFLAPDAREALLRLFDAKYPEMEELEVTLAHKNSDVEFRLERSMRQQFGVYCRPELEEIIQAGVMKQFPSVCDALDVRQFLPGRHDLRLDYTPDGGFGKMHQDVGFGARLSYLYYFHRQPKKFRGGDLLFFDQNRATGQPLPHQFTRICHEDNLLLIFPPQYFHQVTRVAALDLPLQVAESRLSVCGFIHPKEV